MRRFGLRDDQWERIKNLLPGRERSVGVTAADNRLFVEAVLYRYRTGMPWRDLPERFGEGTKIHTRFSRSSKSGVWERMFQHLAADAANDCGATSPNVSIATIQATYGRAEGLVCTADLNRSNRWARRSRSGLSTARLGR